MRAIGSRKIRERCWERRSGDIENWRRGKKLEKELKEKENQRVTGGHVIQGLGGGIGKLVTEVQRCERGHGML